MPNDKNVVVEDIPLDQIERDPNQPRLYSEDGLEELIASIEVHGVLNPITVERVEKKGKSLSYKIITGERRYLASKALGKESLVLCKR